MNKNLTDFVAAACNFDPADSLLPFTVNGVLAGWMKRTFAAHLDEWPEHFTVRPRGVGMLGHFETAEHRSAAIAEVVESLASQTVINGWRSELVTASESFYSPPLFHIERAASRHFGMTVYASHLNGFTVRNSEPCMWIGRRAESKDVDPGKLDNLTAGRIPRGMTPFATLIKECAEEAGMAPALAKTAKAAGAIRARYPVDEGLHNEIIFVHDVILAESFEPQNQDGEVAEFVCMSIADVLDIIETRPAEFTRDAALVILDCLIRRGYLTADRDDYLEMIHAMRP
jgi:8-oxo-dGTP pyrophosphatase MutT (NUDIX family)